jgi:heptosyltransferase-2
MKSKINIPNCKKFNGYKPCKPGKTCDENCNERMETGTLILIINLDAMGDVLMTTAQLIPIKNKYPNSTIFWVTRKNAKGLLIHNPYIDKILEWNFESVLYLQNIKFDVVFNADKSSSACSLLNSLVAKAKYGFGLNDFGAIIPLNQVADYNFILGIDDYKKFKLNQRTGQDILAETFDLEYTRSEYILNLAKDEEEFCNRFKLENNIKENDIVVGINTGCSELYPNKKLTIEQHITLIKKLLPIDGIVVLLLGGPEDTERNKSIYNNFSSKIITTPTTEGIRKGICYENIADIVITGDSFGMHLAIALKKYVIAWFGLSCWTEIDLYDRGLKLFNESLECSPCWLKECPHDLKCRDLVDIDRIVNEIKTLKTKINKK